MSEPTEVATALLRHGGALLCLRRGESAETHPGQWDGVSVAAGDDPEGAVRAAIGDATGLAAAATLVRRGSPVRVDGADGERVVHPFLFDCPSRDVTLGAEYDATEWIHPTAFREYDTVPGLWRGYERVAPTVQHVAADGEHGAAYLSVRALEVLRDRAGLLVRERGEDGGDANAEWAELTDLATRLRRARPSMAVLGTRVDRALATAAEDGRDAPAVAAAARDGIETALAADADAARAAAEVVGDRVLTLSRSGTVRDALRESGPETVYVAESRPACEGRDVAEALADGTRVVLHTDAAVAHVLATEPVDTLLVGADAVLADGRVVNKTGTRAAALAAAHEGVDAYAVAASAKVSTSETASLESGSAAAVYDGDADVDAVNPTFDVTPAELLEGVVTERGVLETEDVREVAAEHEALADWRR